MARVEVTRSGSRVDYDIYLAPAEFRELVKANAGGNRVSATLRVEA